QLLHNFKQLAVKHGMASGRQQQGLLHTPRPPAIPRTPASPSAASGASSSHCSYGTSPSGPSLALMWCKVPGLLRTPHLDTQLLFTNLVGWGPDSFWLDRLMVTDQVTGDVYLLALYDPAGLAGSPGPPSDLA
ncbi:hypothetical protein HaLaN_19228, partial [Haematococcus lacustris]